MFLYFVKSRFVVLLWLIFYFNFGVKTPSAISFICNVYKNASCNVCRLVVQLLHADAAHRPLLPRLPLLARQPVLWWHLLPGLARVRLLTALLQDGAVQTLMPQATKHTGACPGTIFSNGIFYCSMKHSPEMNAKLRKTLISPFL